MVVIEDKKISYALILVKISKINIENGDLAPSVAPGLTAPVA
jgi:hypothetical protein